MDINSNLWHKEVVMALKQRGVVSCLILYTDFILLEIRSSTDISDKSIFINMVSLPTLHSPEALIRLKMEFQKKQLQLIHLWEDIWTFRATQVINRLCSLIKIGQINVHGRQTSIIQISQAEANQFMNENHLQGGAKARYRFALISKGKIVSMATFSAKRRMTLIHNDYFSVELIRFANAAGLNVQGGLSKLLKHLAILLKPNDIMTYVDMDWSTGAAYSKIGFKLISIEAASIVWLCLFTGKRYFPHRLPSNFLVNTSAYMPLFNTGNLKYKLYL